MTRRLPILLALSALVVVSTNEAQPPDPAPDPSEPAVVSEEGRTVSWAPPVAVPRPTAEAAREAYATKQWLVSPPSGTTLAGVAARLGGSVRIDVGRSGFGVIEVPDDARAAAAFSELGVSASPQALVYGAKDGELDPTETAEANASSPQTGQALPAAWHVPASGVGESNQSLSSYVVAVLDSGVAYENHGPYAVAPGLQGTRFVAPADFIELDGHANDDHQHGTHIASIIGSQGVYPGIAPGVSIMPVKVLDFRNRGNEWALVEGLHHAVEQGADVINLSLSFPIGYVASPALNAALLRAHEAGVVIVGAAGNEGEREIAWPAASPLVVAVGASESGFRTDWFSYADYSNRSPAIDVLAPGGSLDRDFNEDGFGDGIVAETIVPSAPSQFGLYSYEGTSQAAAVVSGAVVRMLANGVEPWDVAATLQQSHRDGYSATKASIDGSGASHLDLGYALERPATENPVYVGLLPYLERTWLGERPAAQVVVVDDAGAPIQRAGVLATVRSEDGPSWRVCWTDADGVCDLKGPLWSDDDAWSFQVDKVVKNGVAINPGSVLFASESGEVVLQALEDALPPDGADEQTSLAVWWDRAYDPILDANLAESWAVVNTGSGLLSSPLGLLFRPRHMDSLATWSSVELDPDGTGLLSSPLGFRFSLPMLRVDGTGLLSSPLGFRRLTLVSLNGNGLLSSPLGFHPSFLFSFNPQVASLGGSGLLSSPLGFQGRALLLGSQGFGSGLLSGTAHEAASLPGGLAASGYGYEPSSWLVGTGAVEAGLVSSDEMESSSVSAPERID